MGDVDVIEVFCEELIELCLRAPPATNPYLLITSISI